MTPGDDGLGLTELADQAPDPGTSPNSDPKGRSHVGPTF